MGRKEIGTGTHCAIAPNERRHSEKRNSINATAPIEHVVDEFVRQSEENKRQRQHLTAAHGQPIQIEWKNNLPDDHFLPVDPTFHNTGVLSGGRSVVHVHGAKVEAEYDGYPES